MKKRNKSTLWFFVSMLIVMAILITGCQSDDSAQDVSDDSAQEPVEIHFAYATFNQISEELDSVEDAINAITIPEINVSVVLHPYSITNYTQQINLSLQSGEELDVFHTLGDFPQAVAQNKLYPITDLVDDYAPEAKEIVGDTFLKASVIDGELYGIPTYKGVALAPNLVYRADIMESIGVDPATIESVDDLTDVFALVKEQYPEMVPLIPSNPGVSGLIQTLYGIDYLSDDAYSPKGVLVGDDLTVKNFYATDEFKELTELARDWYEKGYIMKDAATTTSNGIEIMGAGNAFSYIASYAGTQSHVQISAQTGQDINMVRLAEPYLGTYSVNGLTWSVASTSEHPEKALQLINLIFSDEDVINLIIYGIEGRDYVKVGDQLVAYPEGLDANTVPYTAQLSCGLVGNQFIQYQMEGTDLDDLQFMLDENVNAAVSPAFGFSFDNSEVTNEVSAVVNVVNEFLPGLNTGSLDPETELPKFIEKLDAAGMGAIIEEEQAQLDAWLAQQ